MEMATLTSVRWEIISGNNIGAGGYLKLGRRKRVGPLSDLQEWHTCIGQTSSLPLSLYYYYFRSVMNRENNFGNIGTLDFRKFEIILGSVAPIFPILFLRSKRPKGM